MNNKYNERETIKLASPTFIREYINLEGNLLVVNKSEVYSNKKFLVNI